MKHLWWCTLLASTMVFSCAVMADGFVDVYSRSNHTNGTTAPTNVTTAPANGTTISSKPHGDPELCIYMSLAIVNLYNKQHNNSHQYFDLCYFKFVHIFSWFPGTSDILLYGSAFIPSMNNWNDTSGDVSLRLPDHVFYGDFALRSLVSYRVVIRYDLLLAYHWPNGSYVTVKGEHFTIPTKSNSSNAFILEYMIPQTFVYNSSDEHDFPSMSIPPNTSNFITDSYVAVCINPYHPQANCSFKMVGRSIECFCAYNHKGPILPIVDLLLFWAVLVYFVVYCWWTADPYDPEVQLNVILCITGKSTHDYLVVLRVGPATDGFDYANSYIDVLLLTEGTSPIGATLRYSCCNLPERRLGELHMVIGRISPQTPITGVTINHSDKQNVMCLVDLTLVNLNGTDQVIMQEEVINKLITCDEATFIFDKSDKLKSKQASARAAVGPNMSSTQEQLLTNMSHSLDDTDKFAMCAALVGFEAVMLMLAQVHFHLYANWKAVGKSMGEFGIWLTMVTAASWAIILALRTVYLKFIKKRYERECFSTNPGPCCFYVRTLLLLALYVIAIALSIMTICLSTSLDHVGSFLWSGMFLVTMALTLGVWLFLEDTVEGKRRASRAKQDFMDQMFGSPRKMSVLGQPDRLTSDLNSAKFSSGVPRTLSPGPSLFGPKMFNPDCAPRQMESYQRFINRRRNQNGSDSGDRRRRQENDHEESLKEPLSLSSLVQLLKDNNSKQQTSNESNTTQVKAQLKEKTKPSTRSLSKQEPKASVAPKNIHKGAQGKAAVSIQAKLPVNKNKHNNQNGKRN